MQSEPEYTLTDEERGYADEIVDDLCAAYEDWVDDEADNFCDFYIDDQPGDSPEIRSARRRAVRRAVFARLPVMEPQTPEPAA